MIGEKQIEKLLNSRMDRKDFLRYLGIMLFSVLGVGNAISAITEGHKRATPKSLATTSLNTTKRGFGGGKYGA